MSLKIKPPMGVLDREWWLKFRKEDCEASIRDYERYLNDTGDLCRKYQSRIDEALREYKFVTSIIDDGVECLKCGGECLPSRLPQEARRIDLGWNEAVYAGQSICDHCVGERMLKKIRNSSLPWYEKFFMWIGW